MRSMVGYTRVGGVVQGVNGVYYAAVKSRVKCAIYELLYELP